MSRVKYSREKSGQSTIHHLTWNIPDFLSLVKKIYVFDPDEYLFDNNEDRTKSNFKLQIICSGHKNAIIEVYYITPITVFMCANLQVISSSPTFEFKSNNQIVHANTSEHLATFHTYNKGNRETYIESLISCDKTLSLVFRFIVFNGEIEVQPSKPKPIYEDDGQFNNNLENLLSSGLYSDIVIKSADNVEYKVHRAMLASRSAVLKAHFEHNTIECQTGIVSSPLDSDVLKEVLTFIYTDKAPRVDEIPESLLAAGDYYQLEKLKNLASIAVYEKLTVDNAIETIQLADLHSASNLKKWTLDYIKCGHASSLTRTESWAKLNSVELTKTLFEYLSQDDDTQK